MTSGRPRWRLLIAVLADQVDNPGYEDRRAVAATLASLESHECVPVLSRLTQDDSRPVRVTAAIGLARLGESLGIATLETLRHHDAEWEGRQLIAEAFGQTDAPAAVDSLLDMLDDSDFDVKISAAKSLGLLKQDAAIPALRLAAERDSSMGVRIYAAEALTKLDRPVDRALLLRMTDDDNPVKQYLGASGLLKLGDPAAIDVLGKLTNNASEHVQRVAATALCSGQVRIPRSLLLTMARSKSPYVRASTARALGTLDGEQPFRALLALASDRAVFVLFADDPDLFGRPAGTNLKVAEIAAAALASSRGSEADELLLRLVNSPDSAVSRAATRALASRAQFVDDEAVSSWASDSSEQLREAAAELIGAKGTLSALNDLLALAEDPHIAVQAAALVALGRLGGEQVLEPLINGLEHPYWLVQCAAARGLEVMAQQAVDILIGRMNQAGGAEVPANAIWLLDMLGDSAAVRPVIAARGTGDPGIWQRVVAEAVEGGDRSIIGSLIAALQNGNPRVRESAAEALAALGGRDAVVPVAELMSDPDWEVRLSAASTLGRIGPSAIDLMASELREGNRNVRAGLASLLGQLQAPEAVDALIQALEDPGRLVRANAAEALGRTGDPRAVQPLIRAVDDPDRGVRNNAAAALRCLGTPESLARVRTWILDRRRAAAGLAADA